VLEGRYDPKMVIGTTPIYDLEPKKIVLSGKVWEKQLKVKLYFVFIF